MKIVLAFDSFKGSLTSSEVANAFEEGLNTVLPHCEIIKIPVADGGEGTMACLTESLPVKYVSTIVADPLGRPITARYGVIEDATPTAIIEMAAASGLPLLSPEERNPLLTSTYGTGQLIAHALQQGCRKFIVGIGGSATNDGGTGMLRALGYRLLDSHGHELSGTGGNLKQISSIDDTQRIQAIQDAEFIVACDVNNPFYGPNGATHIFAPQKGADSRSICILEDGMKHFAGVISQTTGIDVQQIPGAGAAGGLGGTLHAFLNGTMKSGIDTLLHTIHFDSLITDSDYIITGEGKLDRQSLMGKVPIGILRAAQELSIPVIAIGGMVEQCPELAECGFHSIHCINCDNQPLTVAMQHEVAFDNVRRTAIKVGKMMAQENSL